MYILEFDVDRDDLVELELDYNIISGCLVFQCLCTLFTF